MNASWLMFPAGDDVGFVVELFALMYFTEEKVNCAPEIAKSERLMRVATAGLTSPMRIAA